MAHEDWSFQPVLVNEVLDVFGHHIVVVSCIMG